MSWFLSRPDGNIISLGEDEPEYHIMSASVGGYIEYVPPSMFEDKVAELHVEGIDNPITGKVLEIIVNEEGKLRGFKRNVLCSQWTTPYDILVGDVVFKIEVKA